MNRERTKALVESEKALKLAKEKAELANASKSQFVSMVSHELRTPLTSIKGAIDLILYQNKTKEIKELGQIIQNNTERLLRLIQDVLDLEQMTHGQMRLQKNLQSLQPLIQSAVESNQIFANQCQVKIQVEYNNSTLTTKVDADRFIQVLDNLLSNAIKVSPKNACVKVCVTSGHGRIQIIVQDEGRGIPKKLIHKIFTPFVQGQNMKEKGFISTGLGLSIAKSIIEQHEGTLNFITSNKGTQFIIELPELGKK